MNRLIPLVIGALATTACATSRPPHELIDARTRYAETVTTRAESNPALLGAARDALDRAERSFAHHGDIEETRDLAYVADRTAEVAQSRARMAAAQQALRRVEEERANELGLQEGTRVPRDTIEALIYTTGALTRGRLVTQEATRKAAEPIDSLQRLVPMQRSLAGGWSVTLAARNVFDADGIVIGRSSAQLDAIAHTIVATNPEAIVTVESHADSPIGEVHDVFVARMRANAVAAYLSTRGVPHDHVRRIGLGPRHILPGSASYDMRGLDRRIKITVE
jgi:outer membrane protein OmpA-like peptidoglycan-associated protein